MSIEARQEVVRKVECSPSQADDFLDTNKTNTYLIAMLLDLIPKAKHKLLITAVASDHSPGTNHGKGLAVDLWHADWATVGDEKITDVMKACSQTKGLTVLGLAGIARQYRSYVTWPPSMIVFDDHGDDHLHLCVATDGSW